MLERLSVKYLKNDRSMLSKAKRLVVGLMPRKFHCFCIGAEKTGTTTIAGMFSQNYRSGHEVDPGNTTQLIVDYVQGIVNEKQVITLLKKRDKLLNLEMESSHHFVHLSNLLPVLFQDAKFIITVREPYSLLESRLNWHTTPTKPAWKNYNDYFFKKYHTKHEAEEDILKSYNLYSLDTYLKQYSDHYKYINDNIPAKKRIFIKTKRLNESKEKIASFLNIQKNTISITHSKKNKDKKKILMQMDQSFVRRKIWENCSDIIKDFFPETVLYYK